VPDPLVSRRYFLVGAAALCAAACSGNDPSKQRSSPPTAPRRTAPSPSSSTNATVESSLRALERTFDARLGVAAFNTANQARLEYNADERFAYCSTHKVFSAAAVLRQHSIPELDTIVRFRASDVLDNSPITQQHVADGMTLRALCDAAIRYSDNTAANLLFSELGGPTALQGFIRSLGDSTTNCSRVEPALNSAIPGDVRDTTTPNAWAEDLRRVALGEVLPEPKRAILVDWLVHNLTGSSLIRASVPAAWKVADKTGSGYYGTRNDIAVIWPAESAPIVLAIMSSRPRQNDKIDDQLVAKAARVALDGLR
jgi:beta-lactamase class A